ncbi:MAG: proline--tRNA ligase [Bacillota bacterium]
MRLSKMLVPTLRDVPAEAEIISHQLLLRAGYMRKVAAGVYTLLPMGLRVVEKITQIVREEMNKAGGQELYLPIIQPAELWLKSGRWHVYGDELFRLKDRHGREFCLGPTHEEIITDLVKKEVNSYKQLPLLLFQIQNKYRDERRPRFGLMRGREFIMKDLYSFDKDEEGLEKSYQKMYQAYTNIFSRCGLGFRAVEADSGAIGGNRSHEFVVLAGSGEAEIVYCESCDYAANVERAEGVIVEDLGREQVLPLDKVATPGVKTILDLIEFMQISIEKTLKTLVYLADSEPVAVVVRGDRDVNEIKLKNEIGCLELELPGEDLLESLGGVHVGSIGPVSLENIPIYLDREAASIANGVTGANEPEMHYINLNYPRDYKATVVGDFIQVRAGDPCPLCQRPLSSARGIEVGQVFKLGTVYSKSMGATFLDEKGDTCEMVMGCYGIGVTRTMAAAVEQNYDENGIIWPRSIAPFQVAIIPVSSKDEQQCKNAERIYERLQAERIECLLDDRDERAGVKFMDADLNGYPFRITVGKKTIQKGTVDIKNRRSGLETTVKIEDLVGELQKMLKNNY